MLKCCLFLTAIIISSHQNCAMDTAQSSTPTLSQKKLLKEFEQEYVAAYEALRVAKGNFKPAQIRLTSLVDKLTLG